MAREDRDYSCLMSGRGNSLLCGDFRIRKTGREKPQAKHLPRIKDWQGTVENLALQEWISLDGWSGGHYWIVRKDRLPKEWTAEGERIIEPEDFLALIARAKAHLSALGKTETVGFSEDMGGGDRAEPMRDVIGEGNHYINANYLEGAVRALGHVPERWHIANLNSRDMAVAYDGEDPVIVIALAR